MSQRYEEGTRKKHTIVTPNGGLIDFVDVAKRKDGTDGQIVGMKDKPGGLKFETYAPIEHKMTLKEKMDGLKKKRINSAPLTNSWGGGGSSGGSGGAGSGAKKSAKKVSTAKKLAKKAIGKKKYAGAGESYK